MAQEQKFERGAEFLDLSAETWRTNIYLPQFKASYQRCSPTSRRKLSTVISVRRPTLTRVKLPLANSSLIFVFPSETIMLASRTVTVNRSYFIFYSPFAVIELAKGRMIIGHLVLKHGKSR